MTGEGPRIVHVASGREWRGGQRQVLLLARELARQGVPQTVVTTAGSRLARDLQASGVSVREVSWDRGLSAAALMATWREARRGGALIHAHDGHGVTIAAIASAIAGRPWIASRRTAFAVRRPARWRRARRVIAVSGAVADEVARAGVDRRRIEIVPSAIDLAATRATPVIDLRTRLGLPGTTRLVLNVAALTAEKDHETLVRAAAGTIERDPSMHWVVAGDGPRRPQVTRLIRNLGLESRIHLLGWVDEPAGILPSADVFALSSRVEGAGTVLLEAMALGVPVVATRAGGIPETVGEGGLLVPSGDPDALAGAVSQVVADHELRDKLVRQATQVVARRDASGMADRVRVVYRSVSLALDAE